MSYRPDIRVRTHDLTDINLGGCKTEPDYRAEQVLDEDKSPLSPKKEEEAKGEDTFNLEKLVMKGEESLDEQKTNSAEGQSQDKQAKPLEEARAWRLCSRRYIKKCVVVTFILMLLVALIVPCVLYIKRQPTIDKSEHRVMQTTIFEEVLRYYFNLSQPRFLGSSVNEKAVATIVQQSGYYDAKKGLHLDKDQVSNLQWTWAPYGAIDMFNVQLGICVRGLNLENNIFYFEVDKLNAAFNQQKTTTSRLLNQADSTVPQAETGDMLSYLKEALKAHIAQAMGVDKSRVIITDKTFYHGIETQDNQYEIQTYSQPPKETPKSTLTAEQLKAQAQKMVKEQIMPVVEQKMTSIRDYGVLIGKMLGFNFDRNTDLYLKYEVRKTLGTDDNKQQDKSETADSHEDQNAGAEGEEGQNKAAIIQQFAPRPPVMITYEVKPLLPIRPRRVRDGKTVTGVTYNSIIECIHYNETSRLCSSEEWNNLDSPYVRTEESIAKEASYIPYKVLVVTIEPLPDDQVVQEPYETFRPEDEVAQSEEVQMPDPMLNGAPNN